jgi:osmotically inducible lipoprotein OsmB
VSSRHTQITDSASKTRQNIYLRGHRGHDGVMSNISPRTMGHIGFQVVTVGEDRMAPGVRRMNVDANQWSGEQERWRRQVLGFILSVPLIEAVGCAKMIPQQQRAWSGGAIGSAGGAAIGAAIGAAVGGAVGAATGALMK